MSTITLPEALSAVDQAVARNALSASAAANLRRWLTEPAYAAFVPALLSEIAAGSFARLDAAFWEVIPFGTGGRRGMMDDFGSATINVRTIAESAHGLAQYLRQHKPVGGKAVVAHDTRHRSQEFARLTAATLAAHGIHVYGFDSHRSTPELSFAVRHLGCDVGVMISASHNPPADNGFKAYWSHGGQVLPPHDKGIIDCVASAGEIPTLDVDEAVRQGRIEWIGERVDAAYVDAVVQLSLSPDRNMAAVFTPLHGVGETSVYRVLQAAGFRGVEIFEPQRTPDGAFPHVPDQLPNPERRAVFVPAERRAEEIGAGLVLASDPDADRLGVSVRGPHGFVHLTGNQIAALLTDYVLRQRRAAGTLSPDHFIVETVVTTPLVAAIGRSYGVRVVDDLLVGFKYIGQAIDRFGPDRFVFGCEESLGYLAGQYARDKDAAIAALYLMELAAGLRRERKTLLDRLDELYAAHGHFIEDQFSETCHGPSGKQQIQTLMAAFRTSPPAALGGMALERMRDYAALNVVSLSDGRSVGRLPEPKTEMVFFESAPGAAEVRVAVRPSGTEPKIKFYFFVRRACPAPEDLPDVKAANRSALDAAMADTRAWVQSVLHDGDESDG